MHELAHRIEVELVGYVARVKVGLDHLDAEEEAHDLETVSRFDPPITPALALSSKTPQSSRGAAWASHRPSTSTAIDGRRDRGGLPVRHRGVVDVDVPKLTAIGLPVVLDVFPPQRGYISVVGVESLVSHGEPIVPHSSAWGHPREGVVDDGVDDHGDEPDGS